ncbi:uncharacterized protein LOC144109836 [Amblyomma americanum]
MAAALYFCRTPLRLATERRHRATVIACLACGALLHMLTWKIAPTLTPHSQPAFAGVNLLNPTPKIAERYDSYEPRLPHRGGCAVAERCLRPLDMLVFAHCSARECQLRAALRDTLFEDAALRRLNWTGIFFSGRPSNNSDLNAWLDLEADLTADLDVFPCKGGNFNITPMFVGGMRWVADHCPTLQEYYRQEVVQKPEYLHCRVNVNSDVIRNPHSRYYVPEEDLPARKYGTYCAGASVIMTYAVMRELLRAASLISIHSTDDAYGFGDLALAVDIGDVELCRFMEWNENRTDCVSYGICMLTHEGTKYGANSRRRGQ